jgi:peptide chain release factor 2
MSKQLLFSVTASDCDWSYYVGPGDGGQKKQKTHSGVICTHRASSAQARCHAGRSQWQNKKSAFVKMAETPEFKMWHRMEVARRTGELKKMEDAVEKAMDPKNLKVETLGEKGWSKLED